MSLQQGASSSQRRVPNGLKVELTSERAVPDLVIGDQLLIAHLSKVYVCSRPVLSQDRRADASKHGAPACSLQTLAQKWPQLHVRQGVLS